MKWERARRWWLACCLLLVAGFAFAAPAKAGMVDINTADAGMLADSLVGVGPVKAEAIVQYRQVHGPFKSADELVLVKGIGPKTLEKNRDRIEVGRGATLAPPVAREQVMREPKSSPKQ